MLVALLVFCPNFSQVMLVFQNSASFIQYYARQKWAKQYFINLLYYYYCPLTLYAALVVLSIRSLAICQHLLGPCKT